MYPSPDPKTTEGTHFQLMLILGASVVKRLLPYMQKLPFDREFAKKRDPQTDLWGMTSGPLQSALGLCPLFPA